MILTIELCDVHKIQDNIDAIGRAINGNPEARDMQLLADTQSILMGIKAKIEEKSRRCPTVTMVEPMIAGRYGVADIKEDGTLCLIKNN